MKLRKLTLKLKNKLKQSYIVLRKRFLKHWTKISEDKRKSFILFLDFAFKYFQNALLLSVPICILTDLTYLKSVLCVWFSLPFLEHYYVWLREKWKDELVK